MFFGDTLFGGATDVDVLAFANFANEDGWYALITWKELV